MKEGGGREGEGERREGEGEMREGGGERERERMLNLHHCVGVPCGE